MKKLFLTDFSAWAILLANLACLYGIYNDPTIFAPVFWAWYLQSLFIGILFGFRILILSDYSTRGLSIAGFPDEPPPSLKLKVYAATFSFLPLLFFHLIYYVFAVNFYKLELPPLDQIYHLAGGFFAAHIFSFIYHKKYSQKNVNLGSLIVLPLLRVLPTHLFIILGAVPFLLFQKAMIGYLIFAALKTVVDLAMHHIENSRVIIDSSCRTDKKPAN